MPARQHTPMSGSPVLADMARGSAARAVDHDNGYDDAASPIRPIELKPKVAPRGKVSGSFAAPLRDSFRESFFDLAQRYQSLRDAARSATRAKKKEAAPLMNTAIRERRLTDLPPPSDEETEERELPEEPTLVQPLALRPTEPVPPASEKRPTTVRPPPPPDPLPRMFAHMASTMPPPVALPSSVPPPPLPPQSVWRPMLAAAALSATIGALVAGGFMALRGLSSSHPATAEASTAAPVGTHDAASAGPCPVGAGSTASNSSTSSGSLSGSTPSSGTYSSSGTYTTSASTSRGSSSSSSSSNGAAPLQVSIDNLPLESSNGKLIEPRASVLPANAFAHVAPVTISHAEKPAPAPAPAPVAQTAPAPKAVTVTTPKQTAAERKRAKREAQAAAATAHESPKASDDDDDDSEKAAAAPPPPPAPTKGPDRAAIAKAVGRATGAATSCDSGPRQGRALITFAPSGNVQSVALVESFGDNAVNGCVLRALGRAHVPPFAGGPIEVRKGISW